MPESSGALVLLALWPPALLFPVAVPLGLGQVLERLESTLVQEMQGSPLLDLLPLREVELQPLLPINEVLCVAIGVLLPCLLAYSVLRQTRQRLVMAAVLLALGLLALVSMPPTPLVLVSVVDKLLLTLLIWACELMVLLLRLNCEPLTVDNASS